MHEYYTGKKDIHWMGSFEPWGKQVRRTAGGLKPQAQTGEANLVSPPPPSADYSLHLMLCSLLIMECYYALVYWVKEECNHQASHSWKNDLVLRLPLRDRPLSDEEAGWSSGSYPWNVAAELEGLLVQKVHLRLGAVE